MSSSINMTNGAAVSRFFSDGSGELLAVFQTIVDADEWAQTKVEIYHARGLATQLYRTCLHSGESRLFLPPEMSN